MKNKVVFITGAASGIGYILGEHFARYGAHVVFTDVQGEKVKQVTKELRQDDLDCLGLTCDVTKEADIKGAIQQTIDHYGTIDVLINNAGFQHIDFIENFPTDTFKQMINTMLVASFIAIKHVFPLMKKQQKGRIINIASINGLIGFAGKAAYNSAKHGVIGLTKVAALEGAESGITVNAICPGYVDTPLVRNQLEDLAKSRNVSLEQVLEDVLFHLVPQKRLLDPQEVADYVMFLAGEQARGVTGQAVVLDGGYTAQ